MSSVDLETWSLVLEECAVKNATLIAVSKTKPTSAIQLFYDAGQRHFGENRVQELVEKAETLPKDIHWHAIGHLQTNKVKYIAPFIHLIHSVDSEKVLKEINKEAIKNDRQINVLLQFHIAEEDSKYGLHPSEFDAQTFVKWQEKYDNISFHGVMGMATFTDHDEQIQEEFQLLKSIFDRLKPHAPAEFIEISMGMSGDYPLALQEGSTMIRVGSLLFGSR